jgi:cytochrome c nitrite reductase small subunit
MTPGSLAGIAIGVAAGIAAGVGSYTFLYAKGSSYLTNDPAACANCHIMSEQFAGWVKSSHRAVAVCNDCHAPHDLAGKYLTKAENGFRHSLAFTTGRFPEPIRITPRDREITEAACRHCHEDMVVAIDGPHGLVEPASCIRCHASVGHMH